jgi:hypothetical protein
MEINLSDISPRAFPTPRKFITNNELPKISIPTNIDSLSLFLLQAMLEITNQEANFPSLLFLKEPHTCTCLILADKFLVQQYFIFHYFLHKYCL